MRRFDQPRDHVGNGGIFDPLRSDRLESNIYAVLDPARQPWAWRGGDRPWAGFATWTGPFRFSEARWT